MRHARAHRRRLSPRRTIPVDIVVLGVLTGVLWSLWPAPGRPVRSPALPRHPAFVFAEPDASLWARTRLTGGVRPRLAGVAASPQPPSWATVTLDPSPAPSPLAEPGPVRAPAPLPPLPASGGAGAGRPSAAPAWEASLSPALAASGARLDAEALRAASLAAAPAGGAASAELALGADGLPAAVWLAPGSLADAPDTARAAVVRALRRTRAASAAEPVRGRVAWRWRAVPEAAAPAEGAP